MGSSTATRPIPTAPADPVGPGRIRRRIAPSPIARRDSPLSQPERTDEDLLVSARQGDEEAFAIFLRRHTATVHRWMVRAVGQEDADDMVAKTGARLLSRGALGRLRSDLLPLCDLVTPNLPEAEALAGLRLRRQPDRRLAAGVLADLGARAVLIKGGHARGGEVRDLFFDGRFFTEFVAPRIRTRATHGTGCTLSAAIAANLAKGVALEEAILRAIRYLRAGLAEGLFPGGGFGVPDHFPAGTTK